MRLFTTPFSCWVLVLAVGSLGACQRASYPVDNSAAAACQQSPLPLLADSQVSALVIAVRPLAVPARRMRSAAVRLQLRISGRSVGRSKAKAAKLALIPRCQAASPHQLAGRQPVRRSPLPPGEPVRYRSRGIALLLALLSITYLPLSLHNFYLGYYGRGAAAIGLLLLGAYLFLVGITGGLLGGQLLAIGYVGVIILAIWFFWQLSDLIRIISRDLRPKDGEYKPSFF